MQMNIASPWENCQMNVETDIGMMYDRAYVKIYLINLCHPIKNPPAAPTVG